MHTHEHAQLMLIKYLGKSLAYVRIIKRIDVNGFSTCKLFPICLGVLWSSFESCQVFCCIKYNLHSGSWKKKKMNWDLGFFLGISWTNTQKVINLNFWEDTIMVLLSHCEVKMYGVEFHILILYTGLMTRGGGKHDSWSLPKTMSVYHMICLLNCATGESSELISS